MGKKTKNQNAKKWISTALALAMTTSILSQGFRYKVQAADSKVYDLIGITDFHGQLLDSSNNQVGAALAKAVKDIKSGNPERTLILGGGDLYQGTPISNVLNGVPVQQMFSNMGMEVTTIGNHEFDWGLDTINTKTMAGAKYDIVCSNFTSKKDGSLPYKPYKVMTKDGLKIAVVGAITKETPNIVLPANIKDYDITDAATAINKYAEQARAVEKADVVIASIHEGGNELPKIVTNLKGVDAVFGGHSHSTLDIVVKDSTGKAIPTVIANSTGKGYVDMKMTVNADKTISFSAPKDNYKALAVNASTPLDPEVKAIIDAANENVAPIFNAPIGKIDKDLSKDQMDQPYGESQLGNWMADVVKTKGEAEVGVVNNGGIRLSPIKAGTITKGTIFYLMPFDNTVCTVTMTGAELKTMLEQAVQDNGKGIQVSGIKFTYDPSKPGYIPATKTPGQRIGSIVREKDGSVIKDTDSIKVAAPDFLATGGDTFTVFVDNADIKASFVDLAIAKGQDYLVRNALMEDVTKKGTITVNLNNRIVNKSGTAGPITGTEMSIYAARKAAVGTQVIVNGTVTMVNGTSKFIQDGTAGICIFGKNDMNVGDQVKVSGPTSLFSGLLEIVPTSYKIVATGNKISPVSLTIGKINGSYEGQTIQLKNVSFKSINTGAGSTISDSTGDIDIFKMPSLTGIKAGDRVDVIAAVSQYEGKYQLSVGAANFITKHDDDAKVNIALLTSTDFHNRMLPWDYATDSPILDKKSQNAGSIAQIATIVREQRAINSDVILVDNGDTCQDNSAALFLDKAKYPVNPMIQAMNTMGYDAWILGNHEFNYGMDKVKDFVASSKAAVLSAGVYDKDGKTRIAKNYTIIERDGVKIGLIGITTPNITKWDAANLEGYKVTDPVDEAKAAIAELKGKVDIIGASLHMGEANEYDVANTGIIDVASKCPELAFVIGGHMHVRIANEYVYKGYAYAKAVDAKGAVTYSAIANDGITKKSPAPTEAEYNEAVQKGVLVIEAGKFGEALGKLDLSFEKKDGSFALTSKNASMIDAAGKAIDTEVGDLLGKYDQMAKDDARQVIGKLQGGDLVPADEIKGIPQAQVQPTAMIDLINKVQMFYGAKLDKSGKAVDVSAAAAFRNDANIKAGDIRKADTSLIYKYDNTLYLMEITGKQLKQYMEWSAMYYNQYKDGDLTISFNSNIAGYNYDMFTGVKYDVNIAKQNGQRIENLTKMDGTPIKDTDVLRMTVNNYRSNSQLASYGTVYFKEKGDTLPKILGKSEDFWGDNGRIRDLIRQYIIEEKKGVITPECDNNWKVTGNNWDKSKRAAVVAAVKDGKLAVKPSLDGKTSNGIALTWDDVAKLAVPATGMSIDNLTLSLKTEDVVKLSAVFQPLYAANQNVTWSSSDENVAKVDAKGNVTAMGKGNAVITVKSQDGGFIASCNVTVQQKLVPLTPATPVPSTLTPATKVLPKTGSPIDMEVCIAFGSLLSIVGLTVLLMEARKRK